MDCFLGIFVIVGIIFGLPWLIMASGALAIISDIIGVISGELRSVYPSLASYLLGATIGGYFLYNMGFSFFYFDNGWYCFRRILLIYHYNDDA